MKLSRMSLVVLGAAVGLAWSTSATAATYNVNTMGSLRFIADGPVPVPFEDQFTIIEEEIVGVPVIYHATLDGSEQGEASLFESDFDTLGTVVVSIHPLSPIPALYFLAVEFLDASASSGTSHGMWELTDWTTQPFTELVVESPGLSSLVAVTIWGFQTIDPAPSVPEGGSTLMLIGLGLVGLGWIARVRTADRA